MKIYNLVLMVIGLKFNCILAVLTRSSFMDSSSTTTALLKFVKKNFLANGCIASYGPYNIECLNSIWVDIGCAENGGLYPERLSKREKDDFNLKTV